MQVLATLESQLYGLDDLFRRAVRYQRIFVPTSNRPEQPYLFLVVSFLHSESRIYASPEREMKPLFAAAPGAGIYRDSRLPFSDCLRGSDGAIQTEEVTTFFCFS